MSKASDMYFKAFGQLTAIVGGVLLIALPEARIWHALGGFILGVHFINAVFLNAKSTAFNAKYGVRK